MYRSYSSVHTETRAISVLCLFAVYAVLTNETEQPQSSISVSTVRSLRSLVQSQLLTYEIQEESPRGTLVGNVGQDILNLLTRESSRTAQDQTRKSRLDMTVTNWRDRTVQFFLLDPATGQLRVGSPPDREAICPPTGGSTDTLKPNFIQTTHDSDNSIYSTSEHTVIRGHIAANTPCFVDLKIAYTMRQAKSTDIDAVGSAARIPSDPGLITVRIIVQDINDHAPAFPQSRVTSELGEMSALPEKTTIDLPTAFDPDSGNNGTISYWVTLRTSSTNSMSAHPFESTVTNSATGDKAGVIPFRLADEPLRLVLKEHLDWETRREYDLIVFAQDHGQPQSLTGQLSVHVTVRDENDNVPQFTKSAYMAVINESVLRGTIVIELTASDGDSATNGQLTFSLASPTNSHERLAMQYFGIRTIAPNQAAIYVIQAPDVDAAPKVKLSDQNLANQNDVGGLAEKVGRQFTFHAIVRDNGYPRQLSSRTEVTVFVLDVNDMPPNIFVSYLTPSHSGRPDFGRPSVSGERHHGQVKENAERAFIAFVTVQDFDSGVWGQVRCFTNNEAFELVPVNEASSHVGDTFSQFSSPHQTAGSNGIGAGETGFKLLAIKPFDREQMSEVSFHIICVDNPQFVGSTSPNYANQISPYYSSQLSYRSSNQGPSSVQLTGTALVRVVITDENDNAPQFSRAQYLFSMDEADSSMTRANLVISDQQLFVGRVSASDQDSTSQVQYGLPSDLANRFRIDRESGKIYAMHQFDREDILHKIRNDEFPQTPTLRAEVEADKLVYMHFGVWATDGMHNSTAKIRLLIRDVNDNAPVFTKSQYEFVVSENEQPIQSGSIGSVEAHDVDADANGQIVYRLFDVVNSADRDPIRTNQSTYSGRFTTINMLFTISAKSGQLHLIRKLDREKQSHHIFYVLAIDNPRDGHTDRSWQNGGQTDSIATSTKSHTSTATVTIIVADVNDNAPIITYPTPHGVINVESGAPAGHNLFTVIAHDPDAGENGTVRFTLSMANFDRFGTQSSNPSDVGEPEGHGNTDDRLSPPSTMPPKTSNKSGLFSIDATTGIVFVVEKITEQSANYLLVIGAHDLGRPEQRKTTTTVTVRAHNSQLIQALNTYRLGDRQNHIGDNRNPLGPKVMLDQSSTAGEATRSLVNTGHINSDESRIQLSRDRVSEVEFDPAHSASAGARTRFASITDRTVVVVLATIFALLLMTTIVLILLIKRRRDAEHQRVAMHKSTYDCPPTNNTMRLDQPFLGSKSRSDPSAADSGSGTMTSAGAKTNDLSTLPRLHPIILQDSNTGTDELDRVEYGSPVYGKTNIYPGDPITLIPSNDDYQQPIPACLYDRGKFDIGYHPSAQQLSNSVELLAQSGLTFRENVTLGRKRNEQMSHHVHGLCYTAESDYYPKQGVLLNGHKTRNSKRYQTIDPLMGTFKTLQGQNKLSQPSMANTSNNMASANFIIVTSSGGLSASMPKQKETTDDCNLHCGMQPDANHSSDVSCRSDMCTDNERHPVTSSSAFDDLAIRLHRIKRSSEEADNVIQAASLDCVAKQCTNLSLVNNSCPARSSVANTVPFRPVDRHYNNNELVDHVVRTDDDEQKDIFSVRSPLINAHFKSAQQTISSTGTSTNKGVSFV